MPLNKETIKIPEKLARFILLDVFRLVHIPLVRIITFKLLLLLFETMQLCANYFYSIGILEK